MGVGMHDHPWASLDGGLRHSGSRDACMEEHPWPSIDGGLRPSGCRDACKSIPGPQLMVASMQTYM